MRSALVYLILLLTTPGWAALPTVVLLLGAYYAATDGVLMAIGRSFCPPALRGTGLALIGTATSLARVLASVSFGALWVAAGMDAALSFFAGALVLALVFAGFALARHRTEPEHA